MNRTSIRGVGIAAAAMAATSIAVGAAASAGDATADTNAVASMTTPIADAMATTDRVGRILDAIHAARLAGHREEVARLRAIAAVRAARARAAAERKAAQRAARARAVAFEHVRFVAVRPGSARAIGLSMATARGWGGSQFMCLDSIWTHESNWRVNAYNHSSGAYGIPQAQPGTKLASAGSDWKTNPATQIAWGLAYIARAYGSPCAAWSFWQVHHWY